MAKTYSSDSIKVLSDREHIQLRKAMYIGDASDPRTLLSEIIDNALDECQAGYSKAIVVSMDTQKHIYEVRDYGRGIPHGKKELNGEMKETLEILLTKSNSGGKFDNSAYNCSSGLHGLGITITNALSKHICITSYRKGKYVQGEAKGTDEVKIKYGKSEEPDGTHVIFEPDAKFFPTVDIPVSFVKDRCRIASALGFRTRLIVDGEEINTDASMFDLMKEENSDVSTYVQMDPISVKSSADEIMKVAIKYTSETNERYFGYTNLLVNYLGGTHVQELSKTIVSTWKEFIEKHKNIKPAVELHNNDYLVGLRAVCAVFISSPEFSSQTKEKLVVNKKYFEELMQLFSKQLYKYLHDHADIAHQLVKRFEQYRAAQNALLSQKEIGSLIKINEEAGDNIRRRSVVSKLVDCTSKKRDNTEMFIVEGDSAKGPYLFTRNKQLQAILPLKGKILNVTFKSIKDAVQNSEVCDIANAIGAGIGASCDASRSRYDKIIISSDADEDGKHITSLLASLFINLFPDLVKEGKVWIALPPLYSWGDNPKNFGWCNNINDIPKNVKSFHRFKGLGAMDPEQLKYYCVDPETRNQVQLEYPSDIDEFNRIVGSSQGKHDLLSELGIIERGF
jgi:DNA gyrase subunit B